MKKDEKNCSKGRTKSLAFASTEKETSGLRRSSRGIIPSAKPIAQTSGTRKSERLSPSVTKNPGRVEKKTTASPLRRSYRGKNLFQESSKGSDKNAEASSSIEKIKKEVTASLDDEELVVAGGSHRVAADNDDTRDDNSSPQTDSESERLPVAGNTQNSLEKGTVLPVKLVRDTSPLVETGIGSDTGLPTENSETQKLLTSKPSLESDKDMSLKRKRDTAGIVMDACAIAAKEDDRVMGSDEAIPSPSSCKIAKQPERCATCEKWIKVNSGFADQSVCSCIAQQVQESDPVEQIMKDSGPASRDFEENMQNMQQDKSSDKLQSMYPEYWVPVQLSDVQLEQYCRTLFSQSLSLSSMSKKNLVGALEETLTSVRKACDHPYVMDASLKLVLTKNLELHEILDVEVKASGKLHLLDAMLTQIKIKGFKAVVLYQATKNPGGILLANILEDFVSQRFGQNSYEHGVCHSTKNAIKNFNKESQCFVLLLETRACSQSTKLLRAEAFILFGSSLNPSHDVKLLQKIKIESYSERTKIFRLYSTFTVEEKALILARQNKPPENLNRPLTHALLMWGAVDLFDKLDTPDSGVQSIKDGVIHEFSSILSARDGEENKGKTCLLLEAKQAQGTYSSDSTLYGEERVKFSGEDNPHVFWTKLLGGKNPVWKYCSDTPQRSRKRVTYLEGSKETAKIDNGGTIKKRKKASEDITVDDEERKASEKYHMGDLDSPKVIALKSSHRSASGTKSTMNGNDGFGLHIYGVPEDMLAGIDWSQIPCESQRNLHDVLKPEMAKLCQVLHLSEYSTSMVENFLQYVIENHRVCKEPATTLQAFQIALGWIAALLVEQKLNREESLLRAKSDLAFNCCKEEVDYIYSMLYCMKSLFLERTQGLQLDLFDTKSKRSMVSTKQLNESLSGTTVGPEKNNTKSMRSSEGEECMTVRTGDHNSSARKDIERALTYIQKECKKRLQNHTEKHDEKKLELMNTFAEKKQKLETEKVVECAIIRIQCRRTSTQSFEDAFKRLDYEHERKIDAITSERDEKIKRLEQMHEAEKKKLAEDEAYWISRVDKWAQAELINCAPISGSNKYFSGICSSNTSKNAHDVQTCNDSNVELALPMPHPASVVETIGSTESDQDDQNICSMPSLLASKQSDPAENFQGQNKQAAIESLPGGSPSPSSAAGQQPDPAANIQGQNKQASIESLPGGSSSPSSAAGQQPDPAANIQGQNKQASIESLPGGSSSPSSVAGQQPDPAANIQGQNIDAAFEPQPAGLETVETGGFAALEQGDQVACPLPSSPTGNQPVSGANIEGQDINTSADEPHIAGQCAVEIGDSAVSHQEITGARNACSLPSSLPGTQADITANTEGQNITANTEGQNITALAQLHTAVSDQEYEFSGQGPHDASPLTFSSPGDHPDVAAHIEELNNTTMAESQTTLLDACEMEITEPDPQVVEQSIFANNATQHVHEGGVESSAGVAAPVPSLHDNGTGQSAYQPVPQIPFPVFSDPFQHELEKLRRESEKSKKAYEEKQLTLKAERERKIAEIEEEYQRKSHEVEAQHTSTNIDIETRKNLVIMNKLFSSAFLCKCTNRNPSHPSVSPRGQLAQRAAQVTAPRSFPAPAPAPAPILPRATSFPSSVSRPSGHPLNSTHGSIPQPRPSLISITTPSLSAFPATNPCANARLRCSSAPHINPYRPPSSVPVPATRPTSPTLLQHVTYSTVTTQQQHEQQQQQQQNLGSGLQSNNDVVYLSDDE